MKNNNMMENNKIENSMTSTSNKNERKSLSHYSYEIIENIKDLSNKIFPSEKDIKDEGALNDMAINKELFRTCAIALIKDMNKEDVLKFKENSTNFKHILYLSLEKVVLPEEDKNSIKLKIDSINPEDYILQSTITDKLELLDTDSEVCRMSEVLYGTYINNKDVLEAHAYLNLNEK